MTSNSFDDLWALVRIGVGFAILGLIGKTLQPYFGLIFIATVVVTVLVVVLMLAIVISTDRGS